MVPDQRRLAGQSRRRARARPPRCRGGGPAQRALEHDRRASPLGAAADVRRARDRKGRSGRSRRGPRRGRVGNADHVHQRQAGGQPLARGNESDDRRGAEREKRLDRATYGSGRNEPLFRRGAAEDFLDFTQALVAYDRYRERARRFVTASGVADGDARIRVGSTLSIGGLGPLFNGKYYVASVRHSYDGQYGFRTAFELERPGLGASS